MRKAHSHKKIAKTVSMATDWENPQFDVSLYAKFKEFMTKQRSDFLILSCFSFTERISASTTSITMALARSGRIIKTFIRPIMNSKTFGRSARWASFYLSLV